MTGMENFITVIHCAILSGVTWKTVYNKKEWPLIYNAEIHIYSDKYRIAKRKESQTYGHNIDV